MSAETDQAGKRVIRIVDYDPARPARFAQIGAELHGQPGHRRGGQPRPAGPVVKCVAPRW